MIAKCLCEKIVFDFTPVDGVAMNCFCSQCRRAHGAGYATQILSTKSSLAITQGESLLKEYASSEFGIRAFCSECGSRLMNYAKSRSNYMSVSLACVASPHTIKPSANVQVGSKAEWVSPNRDVPCFDTFPPDINKYM